MSVFHKIKSTEYLASEFLTWLLFRTEAQEGAWKALEGKGGFELWPDDRLRLEAPIDGVTKNLLSGGTPYTSPEAKTALASGKIVQEARWKLIHEEREWFFTLKAPELDLRSVKLPELLTKEDEDRLRERLALMQQAESMVEDLFGRFLAVRISDVWDREELPKISAWITAGVE